MYIHDRSEHIIMEVTKSSPIVMNGLNQFWLAFNLVGNKKATATRGCIKTTAASKSDDYFLSVFNSVLYCKTKTKIV